jgi:diacylglycerol kinase (ATP)
MKRIYGGHSWVYTLSLLNAVFKWKPTKMQLIYDDDAIEDEVFTIAVGNGCYSGGGLKQVPADPTDGLFHTNMIPRPTFKIIITALSYLFRGELWNHPACTMKTTKRFKIKNSQSFLIETDGIMLEGHGPYIAEIIPSALNMIV